MRLKPSGISGEVDAPPSKSMMQRATIAAALAEGESLITNPSLCDDALATLSVVDTLGAQVAREERGIRIMGRCQPNGDVLDCGESGTCMRMISAVAALQDKGYTITGKGSLMKRPVSMVEKPLRELGAECRTKNGMPPIKVKGPIHGGRIGVDGSESSQFISGLLMALPLCGQDSELQALNLKSRAYVNMTLSVLASFAIEVDVDGDRFSIRGGQDYQPKEYEVEGDWSGSAFMLVAGATAGEVTLRKLAHGSQPDEAIKTVLASAGAEISEVEDSIIVKHRTLKAFDYDASGSPDLFPPLAALACSCEGTSVIHGTARLRHKESDRAAALIEELGKMGADIKVIEDRMEIIGKKLKGGKVKSHNDHRIAMACAVAALNSDKGVTIEGTGCVSKSYPGFFEDLERLMVER